MKPAQSNPKTRRNLVRCRSRITGSPISSILRDVARRQKAIFVRTTLLSIRKSAPPRLQ